VELNPETSGICDHPRFLAHAWIFLAGAFAMATNAALRETEYQVRSNPSISDVHEGHGLSQLGPNMKE
jgi:hypothetical protein